MVLHCRHQKCKQESASYSHLTDPRTQRSSTLPSLASIQSLPHCPLGVRSTQPMHRTHSCMPRPCPVQSAGRMVLLPQVNRNRTGDYSPRAIATMRQRRDERQCPPAYNTDNSNSTRQSPHNIHPRHLHAQEVTQRRRRRRAELTSTGSICRMRERVAAVFH